jgi:hypothetical protein
MIHFKPFEFIPQKIWNAMRDIYGKPGEAAMRYINPKIPIIMDYLRDYFAAPITINTWATGGNIDGRCLRLPDDPAYKLYSDHTYGNAVDFAVTGIEAPQIQKLILTDSDNLITLGVTGMENGTPTWTHLSVADLDGWGTIQNGIHLLNP